MTVDTGIDIGRDVLEAMKIAALSHGVRVSASVVAELGGPNALTVHEYATTGGLTLELPCDVLVNAPFDEPFCATSPVSLHRDTAGDLVLTLADAVVPVRRILPLPGYLGALDTEGNEVNVVAMSHADRIRLSPIAGCAYDCHFCDVATAPYAQAPVERVLRALDVALGDRVLPTRHLLISGGSAPMRNARAQAYFEEMCVRVADHVQQRMPDGTFAVDVMMSARADGPAFVDRLIDAGVSGFSLNLEVHNPTHAATHLPLKHKWSREHLGSMIEHAVTRLGRDGARVRSLVIPGLEPASETLAGVEWLARLGCSPVLSPFRPARGTALADANPVDIDTLCVVLDGARESVARHGVLLGPACIPCQHNTLTFPWDVKEIA